MTKQIITSKILCLDVESNGLHGEGFAVGAVVLDESGAETASFLGRASISTPVDAWVQTNVLPAIAGLPASFSSPASLRWAFRAWFDHYARGAVVVADCGWPVEARFLAACVDDDPEFAKIAPYPLHDVATLLLASGLDPIGTYPPDPSIQGTKHDPLYDARCSASLARMLIMGLREELDRA